MSDEMSLGYEEREVGSVTILTVDQMLKGQLETNLRERIDELVNAGRLHIVVNLGRVPYLDSSEIGRLIRSHLSVRQAGGRVRICNVSPKMMGILQMTRLDTVLELYETEEAALATLLQGQSDDRAMASESI